jgi:IS5 family transposase
MSNRKVSGVPLNNIPLNSKNEFYVAANTIDWKKICDSNMFSTSYSPLQPIRRMVGLYILSVKLKISGQELLNQWLQIPYYQYFTGESLFHWELPLSAEEFLLFQSQLNESFINEINSALFWSNEN